MPPEQTPPATTTQTNMLSQIYTAAIFPDQDLRSGTLRNYTSDAGRGKSFGLLEYDWHPEILQVDKGEIFKYDIVKAKTSVPKIVVKEFQPSTFLTSFVELIQSLWQLGETMARDKTALLTQIQERISNAITNKLTGTSASDPQGSIAAIVDSVYGHLINGIHIAGNYEIPILDQTFTFLEGKGSSGWEQRSMAETVFEGLGNIAKTVGLDAINLPTRPMYSQRGNGPEAPTIESTFRLYNYNLAALCRNIEFMYSLIAGSYWVQTHILVRSSNLYHISIPGKANYYFCTLDTSVTAVGKHRALFNDKMFANTDSPPPMPSNILTNMYSVASKNGSGIQGKPIQNLTFPDAYDIKVSFKSLLPNNFNTLLTNIAYSQQLPSFSASNIDKTKDFSQEFVEALIRG